jgi:hypothetical protein
VDHDSQSILSPARSLVSRHREQLLVQDTARAPLARHTAQQIRDIISRGGVNVAARDVHNHHYHQW